MTPKSSKSATALSIFNLVIVPHPQTVHQKDTYLFPSFQHRFALLYICSRAIFELLLVVALFHCCLRLVFTASLDKWCVTQVSRRLHGIGVTKLLRMHIN